MSKSNEQKQFLEWVGQYIDDTITPEDAEKLLEIVRNDPEKLDSLCAQLQTDRLVESMLKRDHMNSIAEAVLKRTGTMIAPNNVKKIQRSRVFLKVAASAAILLGIGSLLMPQIGGRSDMADEVREKSHLELAKEQEPASPQRPRMELDDRFMSNDDALQAVGETQTAPVAKPKWEPAPVDGIALGRKSTTAPVPATAPVPEPAPTPVAESTSVASAELAPLQIEMPKPMFAGTPKQIRSDNLEEAPRYYGSQLRSADKIASSVMPVPSRENYARIVENEFKHTTDKSLSTFSIDVDTAAYANVRRFLMQGRLPPIDAVRIEEMINYFTYDYEAPSGEDPFATSMALTACPWNTNHQLLRVGLQGQKIDEDNRKHSNLVFLLDVSGSMNSPDKLPLLKTGFEKMVRSLGEKDRVAIVVYAGSSGVVLDSTSALEKETIISAMDRLKAGGSTAGGAGIELAYRLATDHYIKDGINRVILATDGDFNVGTSNIDALQKLIEEKRKSGVFLSVLGFGTGNLQDAKMEMLANKGNGNYFYIDSEREAEKVLVKELTANMITIAKDVKIQVEFNPALVRSYRLIGYENRIMAARDFDDDTKDAGEIGAGHQVTALYELVPVGAPATEDGVALKYTQPDESETKPANTSELLTLKLRYKQPEGSKSKLLTFTLDQDAYRKDAMDESFRWATAIAAFGMHLRQSEQIGGFPMDKVIDLAGSAVGDDEYGYRKEAIELMKRANRLNSGQTNPNGYPQWQYR